MTKKKRWIQEALDIRPRRLGKGPRHRKSVRVEAAHPGALHRMLGIPAGRVIPIATLKWASKQPGLLGSRARFALNVRNFGRKKRR